MSVFHEQRICVKLCVKIAKSVTETFEMMKIVFGEEVMCRTQTYEWWKCFKEGRTSVDDDPRLAPANFFLYPKLKSTLKGRRFESIEAIKTNS